MGLFRHPCLVRGIVHTPYGAFSLVRGLVEMPDEIGEMLGWPRSDDDGPQTADPNGRRDLEYRTADMFIARPSR